MSEVKQVKVDNWGIYFLQRLKHFFNRTDYCDLTLQFQDNAQLKVHRLVLNACTEYFELLERTCEMYEDCLVMPDDLQADVVVPIVNFMYTGHLEFRMDLLERLYQTSQILNMPVLTKLLESHRNSAPKIPTHSYSGIKKFTKQSEFKSTKSSTLSTCTTNKRSYSRAFNFDNNVVYRDKKTYQPFGKTDNVINTTYRPPSPLSVEPLTSQKVVLGDPRPTRYEIPEELDTDNVFDSSFSNISYTSRPLMVHPDTVKRYKAKRSGVFGGASSSKKVSGMSTVDIVECKRIIPKEGNLFDDSIPEHNLNDETDLYNASYVNTKDSNQLFDQVMDPSDGPKVTIETKDSKVASNLDHARIISEVLKKYPHLVKSNKNIKLKILDPVPGKSKKQQKPPTYVDEKPFQPKLKTETEDFTYESDVIDSKQAAKLIALGAENIKGPWICLICGTPGKALHFNSYYKFRRHLVEVHNEKPVSNICEYCGLRSLKRNYLLHHLYAQHGVTPPPLYHFPKCNQCSYIALTEGLLVKHKLTHKNIKNFRCNVCSAAFSSSSLLLVHIQNTGHKYSAEKKSNLQCIYCLKVFLRESNLYAHIKTHHKKEAKNDCIIEDSDDDKAIEEKPRTKSTIKFEPSTSYDNEYDEGDLQYPIQQRSLNDVQVVARKQHSALTNSKQKILNPGFGTLKPAQKTKTSKNINQNQALNNDIFQDIKITMPSNNQDEEIVVIDNNEYIMRDHQLIPKKRKSSHRDYILADMLDSATLQTVEQPTTSVEYTNVQNTNIEENMQQQSSMIIKKSANINQPIQIVVSNEEEYKALMASKYPIIFDDGDANKTLTVLNAQHQNPTMDTTTIDIDDAQSNNMMILPHEYPLNVTEAIPTENSNIVVVYSHPVDDQNKQYQILTTGIGAQFVQSSAIITQNYETVTTSTPAMSEHCIETQMEQSWQNDVQSLGQEIQLTQETEMQNVDDANQVEIKPIHNETGNNIDELPEVHLVQQKVNEADLILLNEPALPEQQSYGQCIKLLKKGATTAIDTETLVQNESMSDISNNENVTVIEEPMEIENVLEQPSETENTLEQPVETENMMEQPVETENIMEHPEETENIFNQPIETENVMKQPENEMEQPIETVNEMEQVVETDKLNEQPLVTDNLIEQPVETENLIEQSVETEDIEQSRSTENIIDQPVETENIIEPSIPTENVIEATVTENIIEQPLVTENLMKQSIDPENDMQQPMDTDNIVEQPIETQNEMVEPIERANVIIESPIETESSMEQSSSSQQNEIISAQEPTAELVTTTEYSEVARNEMLDTSEYQQPELVESQAYDDIVEINRVNDVEPIYAKKPEVKIQNLTSEWSEDEYDVAEDNNKIVENDTYKDPQIDSALVAESQEVEETIENIQQEMKNQMSHLIEPGSQTGRSEILSLEEGSQTGRSEILSLEDTSSQDLQLHPLNESPDHTVVQNPQAQQKISSLLNDWEDNDSQEETMTLTENVVVPTSEETDINNIPQAEELTEDGIGLTVETDGTEKVPKNDNIKSLVSDWDDDDDEESKE